MNILKSIKDTLQYLVEAATRIFTPDDDKKPPEIGVQPFTGDTASDRH
ncbi:MAG TPA: isochorismate synthase [Allocoleopsis sp.]